ncbi:activated Cdc42 kinase-like isoform X1 [Eupeodes corollae]|uniref:activated Cdc42 kinase-like isoform X1 n=1 Tax=Eupeodes corollae TaxID=290404 RepID=UPI00248F9615|nr:activated Cdc42 kinase-like isoform X1 [Eupeodes corollae]XP_055921471.1 activated Cdc42 kinase-like isoform X1 [Eupeodes corollae]
MSGFGKRTMQTKLLPNENPPDADGEGASGGAIVSSGNYNDEEPGQIDLYEFLTESELQHYYNSFKNELKIKSASQFKYATDEDLKQIGLSRPEIRRLRKYYEKYYPHGYLSKIKRLLQTPTIVKRDDGTVTYNTSSTDGNGAKSGTSPSKAPNNKHIIPADSICVNKQLGTGEFGIVQQGVWTNGTERIQVAIKCLCRERMQSNPMEFLKEAAIMHSIEHENIVRLYGVVLATDSLMLVTELAHLRSLLECLKDSGLRVSFLTIPTLCEFAMQICNGMKYLENKRLIHRDLAARNILVFSKNKVKISDFGLSRALGVGKDYYKTNFNVNLKLPIAWCAPECINYLRFTNASDVWAYGVCLWEMFSYGFQPWAALTGLQILEAIDEPNYQRLEQPDCCPRDYYNLMMKCWQHDPSKRPRFSEIHEMLPELKPEQLKTIVNSLEPKKDHLIYRQGEVITVLEKNTNTPFWRGVLNSGKTGLFNPANTIAYTETPPSSNRESFYRNNERCSKRKLRTEMISRPQNDFKHTGHIGIDGESFGDVAFLGNSQSYNHLPRQVVTPYKPSEDIEQTPLLLPPTPTSPDSLQTASGYFPEEIRTSSSTNPTFISSNENTPNHHNTFGAPSFDFSSTTSTTAMSNAQKTMFHSSTNPFALESTATANHHARATASSSNSSSNSTFALQNNNYGLESNAFTNANLEDDSLQASSGSNIEDQHEYHEISDDEITADKVFDMGPSLLDEINSMFGTITAAAATSTTDSLTMSKSPDFDHSHKLAELSSKLNRKNSGDSNGNKSKKKSGTGTMKPISVKDEKILNHAIEIANEISARSMTDLVSDQTPSVQSPKRKFSFRFPHLSHHHGANDKHSAGPSTGHNGNAGPLSSYAKEKKNFTEELKSIPDLQRFRPSDLEPFPISDIRIPIFDKEASDFFFEKSREILSRPINIDFREDIEVNDSRTPRDVIGENLLDIENTLKALNLDFIQTYSELDKNDSAETLLNEKFANIVSSLEGEISSASTIAGSLKSSGVYDFGGGVHTKFDFNSATSHIDKHLQHYNDIIDKIEDKRSSTPDTGFASRETNLSLSRRSSQKSSYSPQDSYFSPKDISFSGSSMEARGYMSVKNELATNNCTKIHQSSSPVKNVNASNTSIYSHSQMQNSPLGDYSGSRQRSMSFNDNYNLKSPVLSEPQHRTVGQQNFSHRSTGSFRNNPVGGAGNKVMQYKPRSIKARTLRRLSYNPIVLDSSSTSSDEESDFDRSIAHSECDIRTRVSSKRRRQYLNRKAFSASNDESAQDKLYGSNASIKSAPHYNNYGAELTQRRYRGGNNHQQHFSHDIHQQPPQHGYDEKIYDFGGRGPGNNYAININHVIKPPRAFAVNGSNFANSRNSMFHEFDVSKLTGKSPTSTTYYNAGQEGKKVVVKPQKTPPPPPQQLQQQVQQQLLQQQPQPQQQPPPPPPPAVLQKQVSMPHQSHQGGNFHWPEKIHASTVKQNDILWRQQRSHSTFSSLKVKPAFSSDSSSTDTEEFEFRKDFLPHIPPSPAP